MIEDEELRDLFKIESEEHLQNLEQGLLSLEKNPSQQDVLDEVFREAHSLKGAARMLGVSDVETLSHIMEDTLGEAKRGDRLLDSDTIDRIYFGMDAVEKFVREAVTGEEAGVDVVSVVDVLTGEKPMPGKKRGTDASHQAAAAVQTDKPQTAEAAQQAEAPPIEEKTAASPGETTSESVSESESSTTPEIEEPIPQPPPSSWRPEHDPQPAPGDESFATIELEEVPVPFAKEKTASPPEDKPAEPEAAAAEKPPVVEVDPPTESAPPDKSPGEQKPATRTAPAAEEVPAVVAEGTQEQLVSVKTTAAPPAVKVTPPRTPAKNPSPVAGDANKKNQIDTIRVKPEHLDALMTQAGELTVAKIRVSRRPDDVEEIITRWEDMSREFYDIKHIAMDIREAIREGNGRAATGDRLMEFFDEQRERMDGMGKLLDRLKQEAAEDSAKLDLIAGRMEDGIRSVRMLPLSTIFNLFNRTVRDLSRELGRETEFIIEGGDTRADKRIIEEIKDPLMHMIRNSIDHGLEAADEREKAGKPRTGTVRLRARQTSTKIIIELSDDGKGLDVERIKATAVKRNVHRAEELEEMSPEQIYSLIFAPGFSTSKMITDVSGRGVGMDVVRNNVERLKGSIEVESSMGQGSLFRINLPVTLSTTRVLLVSSGGLLYAIPADAVELTHMLRKGDVFSLEGRQTITINDEPLSVTMLAPLLEVPVRRSESRSSGILPCIVIAVGGHRLGLIVDELLDEQEVILKPHGGLLQRVRNVSGATILESGQVCMVLSPQDLMDTVINSGAPSRTQALTEVVEAPTEQRKQVVLLVEDSITTRMQEKRILERNGYDVIVAVDGKDGFNKLRTEKEKTIDAVVSDIEMPNMNGYTLTQKIRLHPDFEDLPVILVTTLSSEESRKKGLEAGANAYITKGGFDQALLIDALKRLI